MKKKYKHECGVDVVVCDKDSKCFNRLHSQKRVVLSVARNNRSKVYHGHVYFNFNEWNMFLTAVKDGEFDVEYINENT